VSTFERIITIKPAYDCINNQPCVHGSKDCGTNPGANHGRHNAELRMTLRTSVAEVTLLINTGWDLPSTPTMLQRGMTGGFVEFHASKAFYDEQTPQGTPCDLWATCYGDIGYSISDEGADLLVACGSDAVWTWLEGLYNDRFGGAL